MCHMAGQSAFLHTQFYLGVCRMRVWNPDPAVNSLSSIIWIRRIFQYSYPLEIYLIYGSLYNIPRYSHNVHCLRFARNTCPYYGRWLAGQPAVLLAVNTQRNSRAQARLSSRADVGVFRLYTRECSVSHSMHRPSTVRGMTTARLTTVPLCTYISRPSD